MECCVFQAKDQVEKGDGSNGAKLRRMLMNACGRVTKTMLIQFRANRKRWAPDGKKKGKSGKWNRSQKGTIECGWNSDTVSDLTECPIPVQQPSAKKKLKWDDSRRCSINVVSM